MLSALLLLAACAEPEWAPDEAVSRAIWTEPGPPKITLLTVENVHNGTGAHSALLVSGAQRVLFDPAGTFRHPHVPERNDVLFGITPNILSVYVDYHARETYNVRVQEIEVASDVATQALALIQQAGPVPKAQCNLAVTRVLSSLPGFESVPGGWLPHRTSQWFAGLPGVSERLITDDDADNNHGVLIRAARDANVFQPER